MSRKKRYNFNVRNQASSLSFHERVVIDCKDGASRVTSWSASEAKGCAFLLISVLNLWVSDKVTGRSRNRERQKKRERDGGSCVGGNASFKPQLDICSFPRRIPTPAHVSLSRDFDGSRRDARQDVYEPHKNGKTRAALTLSKSFLIARVNDGGKILSSPSVRIGWTRCYYNRDECDN